MAGPTFPARHLDNPVLDVPLKRAETILSHRKKILKPGKTVRQAITLVPLGLSAFEEKKHKDTARALLYAETHMGVNLDTVKPLYPEDYPALMHKSLRDRYTLEKIILASEATVMPIISAHVQAMATETSRNPEPLPRSFYTEDIIDEASTEEVYRQHVETFTTKRAQGYDGPILSKFTTSSAIVTEEICVIKFHSSQDETYVLTYEQLLLLQDTAMMRKNALLACSVIYPNDKMLPKLAQKSFAWQERGLLLYGNLGYELVKTTEPLSKGYMSRAAEDPMAGEGDSFEFLMDKVRLKESAIRDSLGLPAFPPIVTEEAEDGTAIDPLKPRTLSPYLADKYHAEIMFPTDELYQVVELFGLQKFTGHPLVNPYLGGRTAADHARSPDTTLPSDAKLHTAMLCHMFTKAFTLRHHRWPALKFSQEGTRLQALYETQTLDFSLQSYDRGDWEYARFGKEFELDWYEKYLELFDDKSISLYLEEKHYQWDGGIPTSQRRLLIELLMRKRFSLRDVIEAIEDDNIPIRWFICSLYPKEREFKLAARMFAMFCLEVRAAFAAHEANIAEHILPYFPQITMTEDKMSIHKRFMEMTKPYAGEDTIKLLLELDLSAWNLRWRKAVVNGWGAALNDLFGLKRLFTFGHDFFPKCCFMVRVNGCRPDGVELLYPPESDLCWGGYPGGGIPHLGGLEGILQKLWSICTVGVSAQALEGLSVQYTITDQGDNIIVTITESRAHETPLRDQLHATANLILQRHKDFFARVHQDLKPYECLKSSRVITYSKIVYINGMDYPTMLKALSRIYPSSASDFPSYEAYIASCFSGTYTAAEQCKRPERCYWLGLLHASYFISRTGQFGGAYETLLSNAHEARSPRSVRIQLIWPSEIGGMAIIGPYAYLYKGGGDPLSKSLASLKMLQAFLPEAREVIGVMRDPKLYTRNPKVTSLLQDPYGLPITKPTSPEDSVAQETLSVVRSLCQNEDINAVLNFANDSYEEEVTKIISTLHPFNPVIARDLLDSSAMGSVRSIKKMFLKTHTVQQLSRKSADTDIISEMLQAGRERISWMIRLSLHARGQFGMIGSLFKEVLALRSRWDVSGVKPIGITSYLPIDFQLVPSIRSSVPGVRGELRATGADIFYTKGQSPAFYGSRTKSKISPHGFKIVGRGYATSALRSIQTIMSWSDHSEGILKLLDYLSETRCGIPISPYRPLVDEQAGGEWGHRYESRIGERDAYVLGQAGSASSILVDTNHMGYLSGTTTDYPIMYQEFILYMIAMISYVWDHSRDDTYLSYTLIMGDEQLEPMNVQPFGLPAHEDLPPVPQGILLIQDETIMIQRIGGPLWSSNIPVHRAVDTDNRFAAVICEMHRALGTARFVEGLLDHTVQQVSLKIGLPELVGMGMELFLKSAACVAIDFISGIYFSGTHSDRFGRSSNYVVQRVGSLLVGAIAKYLLHPHLADDPVIAGLCIGPTLKYDRRYSPTRALIAELGRYVRLLFFGSRSIYYTMPVTIFASEGDGATLSAIIRLLRRRALQAMVSSTITKDDASFIVGSTIRRMVRGGHNTEADKITGFRAILLTYDRHRRGRHLVSGAASSVAVKVALSAEGSRIYGSSLSAEEVIRTYRGELSKRAKANRMRIEEPCSMEIASVSITNAAIPPLGQTWTDTMITRLSETKGRAFSYGSGAFRTWLVLSSMFKDKTVLIVGSGLGGAAAAALLGGSDRVIGHDLRADFPSDVSMSSYLPPLVRLYTDKKKFEQSELTLATSGDWFNPSVSYTLCNYVSDQYILVLDISTSLGFTEEVLKPLVSHSFSGEVLVRIVADPAVHINVVGTIIQIGVLLRCWEWTRVSDRLERVYHIRVTKKAWPLLRTGGIILDPIMLRQPREIFTAVPLAAYLAAPLGGLTGNTIRTSFLSCIETFSLMLSMHHSKPTFNEWTEVLHSIIIIEWLCLLHDEEVIPVIRESTSIGLFRSMLHPSVLVQSTPNLLRLAANTGFRLIGHLDSPVTASAWLSRTRRRPL